MRGYSHEQERVQLGEDRVKEETNRKKLARRWVERVATVLLCVAPLLALLAWALTWPIDSDASDPFAAEMYLQSGRIPWDSGEDELAERIRPCFLVFCWSLFAFGVAVLAKCVLRMARRQHVVRNAVVLVIAVALSFFCICTATGLSGNITGVSALAELQPDPERAREYLHDAFAGISKPSVDCYEEIVAAMTALESHGDLGELIEGFGRLSTAHGEAGDTEPGTPSGSLYSGRQWGPEMLQEFETTWLRPSGELARALERTCKGKYGYPLPDVLGPDGDMKELMEFHRKRRNVSRVLSATAMYHHQAGDFNRSLDCLRLNQRVLDDYVPQLLIDFLLYLPGRNALHSTSRNLCFMADENLDFVVSLEELTKRDMQLHERLVSSLEGELIFMKFSAIKTGMDTEPTAKVVESFEHMLELLSDNDLEEGVQQVREFVDVKEEQLKLRLQFKFIDDLEGWRLIPGYVVMSWLRVSDAILLAEASLLPTIAAEAERAFRLEETATITALCCALKAHKIRYAAFPEDLSFWDDEAWLSEQYQLPDGYRYVRMGERFVIYGSIPEGDIYLESMLEALSGGVGDPEKVASRYRLMYVIGE